MLSAGPESGCPRTENCFFVGAGCAFCASSAQATGVPDKTVIATRQNMLNRFTIAPLCYAQAVTGDSSGQPDPFPAWKKRETEGSVFRISPRGRQSEVLVSRRIACDVPWVSEAAAVWIFRLKSFMNSTIPKAFAGGTSNADGARFWECRCSHIPKLIALLEEGGNFAAKASNKGRKRSFSARCCSCFRRSCSSRAWIA